MDTIVDYVSTEIEVWGRTEARKNGDIEALADAMRALKNVNKNLVRFDENCIILSRLKQVQTIL